MNGFVYWRGISRIDRKTPIMMVVATKTANRKTGNLLQSWIIREDISPIEASRTGEDYGYCGNCKHRGTANLEKESGGADNRSCYVLLLSVHQLWMSVKRGLYSDYNPAIHDDILRNRPIRLGSFGEAAAIPHERIKHICSISPGWVGYTHQWRKFPGLNKYLMASVDSLSEKAEANAMGWRTFRVKPEGEALCADESPCPASPEYMAFSGRKVQCADCKLCAGLSIRARNLAINVHGMGASNFIAA